MAAIPKIIGGLVEARQKAEDALAAGEAAYAAGQEAKAAADEAALAGAEALAVGQDALAAGQAAQTAANQAALDAQDAVTKANQAFNDAATALSNAGNAATQAAQANTTAAKVAEIIVPGHNRLTFNMKDGSTVETEWRHRSRRESWTYEMKEAAAEKARKRHGNPTMGGYSLAGAVFEVRDAGGTLVDTITTGTDGRAQTKILPLGVYRVKETKAPYGFVLDTETRTATVSGTQGTDSIVYAPDVTVAEQPQVGRINIEKYNSAPNMGDYELTPAVFEIRSSAGTLVDTLTTDAQGKAQSKDLKLGDYTVTEKTAPYGYIRNTNTFNVSLTYGDQTETRVYKTASVPERPQTGIIRVHKLNGNPNMGDYPLNGAVFEVRVAQDIKQRDGKVIYNKGDLADTITTNAAGEAQTKELPLGAYTVREKTAPFGFVLNTEEYNPVLSYKGQDVTVTYTDVTVPEQPQVGTITITKLDKATGTTALTSKKIITKFAQKDSPSKEK